MDNIETYGKEFVERVGSGCFPLRTSMKARTLEDAGLSRIDLISLFRAQLLSRHLDIVARLLKSRGQGHYTIGSSGHEGSAAIAAAVRPTDIAFLHYRDAAFQIARAAQVPGQTPFRDMLLGLVASSEDPISGGRHKVLGSRELNIPPQTSTIASHLPKAVGAAHSIGLAKRHDPPFKILADDGIVLCSFGDASLNHSTAQGAINAACWTAYQNAPMPLLLVCEDNGIGISVPTPQGWVQANMNNRPALRYIDCDGCDVVETYAVARELADWVRRRRQPAFLHMHCVRLFGHAGSDVQSTYLPRERIERDEANDPLLHTARWLVESQAMAADDIVALWQETQQEAEREAEAAVVRPKLRTAEQVMASIVPPPRNPPPDNGVDPMLRNKTLGDSDLRAMGKPQIMARLLNLALTDLMLQHREIVLAGEDIGRKGGVYGVTQRLQSRFGPDRVIDTLLDEQSILGLAIGLAHNGFVPVPEIQFLAYLHNAEDQLRGEAATLPFFSNGQFTNPMIVRVAGLGYQRGFGGHFHNDNSLAVLRDIPGIIVACPSNGRDGVLMLREAVRLARIEQRVTVFVEPIALYSMRDLHEDGDQLWMHEYPEGDQTLPLGEVARYGEGSDLAIVSYANGYYLSRQAERLLAREHGVQARVIDMRWLAPLPRDALLEETQGCRNVLIVDECRRTGSQGESLAAFFSAAGKRVGLVSAEDSFIATGPAYAATLPSRDSIVAAAMELASSSANANR